MELENDDLKRRGEITKQSNQSTVEELLAQILHLRRCIETETQKEQDYARNHCQVVSEMREQSRRLSMQLVEMEERETKLKRAKESLMRKKNGLDKRFSHVHYLDEGHLDKPNKGEH